MYTDGDIVRIGGVGVSLLYTKHTPWLLYPSSIQLVRLHATGEHCEVVLWWGIVHGLCAREWQSADRSALQICTLPSLCSQDVLYTHKNIQSMTGLPCTSSLKTCRQLILNNPEALRN
jgi:hypothetical protein